MEKCQPYLSVWKWSALGLRGDIFGRAILYSVGAIWEKLLAGRKMSAEQLGEVTSITLCERRSQVHNMKRE